MTFTPVCPSRLPPLETAMMARTALLTKMGPTKCRRLQLHENVIGPTNDVARLMFMSNASALRVTCRLNLAPP